MPFDLRNHPHRRLNPLTGEWLLVSPHRSERPWQGKQDHVQEEKRPAYDPKCYLCPGNRRAGNALNPHYDSTCVFTNDFPALRPEPITNPSEESPLLKVEAERGECRVICFSPRHDLTLAEMDLKDILTVVELWAGQVSELKQQYRWVQIFENKGELMGCSNPHPHGQIWAGSALPNEPYKEDIQQRGWLEKYQSVLLQDYATLELQRGERIVVANDDWLVVVPFWAVWPFETMLLPARRRIAHLDELGESERVSLASIIKQLLVRYDNLFEMSFPYSMGWHGAPAGGWHGAPAGGWHGALAGEEANDHWQLHAHFYPPLLRSATVKKFLVGYELLAEAQRDLTPEQAAGRLASLPDVHYKQREKL